MRNPFTPTFGIVPAHLAGRQGILDDMRQAFDNGIGDPNLSTILIGARGTGKTALLSCIAEEAERHGWISANVVAGDGMLEDIIQRALEASEHLIAPEGSPRLSGLTVGQLFGLEWTHDTPTKANWRTRMNAIFEQLSEHEIGLLITVDEVKVTVPEMVRLAATYQLFIRENKKVALVMAGLPSNVTDLLENGDVSFLRRSQQRYLGRINDVDIEAAFQRTVEDAGKQIDDDALQECVQAIDGFPYMMQLVGYRAWEASGDARSIHSNAAETGISRAQRELESGVLATTYRELSPGDRRFLMAMLEDNGPSRGSEIAQRLGKKTNYVSTYKRRLLKQGLIEELPDSTFEICIPFFKEYLRELKE